MAFDAIDAPLLGRLVHDDQDAAGVPAQLKLIDGGIYLDVLIDRAFDPEDRYRRWFSSDIRFGDDPDATRFSYEPPTVLGHRSAKGLVVLLGCRSHAAQGMLSRLHQGTVSASAAIVGADSMNWAEVGRFRTFNPAMAAFSGLSGISQFRCLEGGQSAKSPTTIRLERDAAVELSGELGIRLQPSGVVAPGFEINERVIVDNVALETVSETPIPIAQHLERHVYVRELVSLAAGCRHEFRRMQVAQTNQSGRWLTYVQPELAVISEPPNRQTEFLFTLDDLAADCISTWFALRRKFKRGLDPTISLLTNPPRQLETEILMAGVALEGIGYELSEKRPNVRITIETHARKVRDDIGYRILRDRNWPEKFSLCYNATKHPDKEMPTIDEQIDALISSKIILRTWVASRLGWGAEVALDRWQRLNVYGAFTLRK